MTNIVEIEAGLEFACARRADGTVWCWGSDQYGQLGDMVTHSVCADSIPCSSDRVQVQGINNAIDIAAGAHHACALLVTGEVRCWGRNQFGQLGDASLTDRATPVSVLGLD